MTDGETDVEDLLERWRVRDMRYVMGSIDPAGAQVALAWRRAEAASLPADQQPRALAEVEDLEWRGFGVKPRVRRTA